MGDLKLTVADRDRLPLADQPEPVCAHCWHRPVQHNCAGTAVQPLGSIKFILLYSA